MKGLKADRITIKIGQVWESPLLHVLVTQEDDVVVARCLDFTVSSHGEDEHDALNSLAEAIKEYVFTAIENNALETIPDPAPGKYWRMFNELEVKQSLSKLTQSLRPTIAVFSPEDIQQSIPEITYA
jgi:predicted RNase H-like HicB family nuclease